MAPSAPIVSSMVCDHRRIYSLSTKRQIVKEANQVSPDKNSVFLVARTHHVLLCQIKRWRKQFDKIDATITNNDDYEESQEVIHDSQSWYSNTNNVVDCSILSCSNRKNYNRVSAKNLTRFLGSGRKSVFSENMMNRLKAFYFEHSELTNSFLSCSCVFTLVALVRRKLTLFYLLTYSNHTTLLTNDFIACCPNGISCGDVALTERKLREIKISNNLGYQRNTSLTLMKLTYLL
jgi:hypothetical protein